MWILGTVGRYSDVYIGQQDANNNKWSERRPSSGLKYRHRVVFIFTCFRSARQLTHTNTSSSSLPFDTPLRVPNYCLLPLLPCILPLYRIVQETYTILYMYINKYGFIAVLVAVLFVLYIPYNIASPGGGERSMDAWNRRLQLACGRRQCVVPQGRIFVSPVFYAAALDQSTAVISDICWEYSSAIWRPYMGYIPKQVEDGFWSKYRLNVN